MYKIYYSGMFYKHLLRWNCLASTSGMRSVTCLRTLFAGRFCYPFEDRHGRNTHGYYSGKDVIGIKKDFTSWKSGRVYEILGSRHVIIPHRTMAGHSKWQNIKHIKQAKDAERSLLFSRLARQIKMAVQLGKSVNPKLNSHLSDVISQAKQANMPASKIESILKACEASKDSLLTPFTMEVKGPGGCFIIIETLTDNINRTRTALKYQINKIGGSIVEGLKHTFNHKGLIDVDRNASNLNLETAVDVAIEVGSEEVLETVDADGTNVIQFQCDPNEFYAVKNALESRGYILKASGIFYLPIGKVTLNEDQLNVLTRFFQSLEENPDVTNVFDNIE